jgi:hypothetical protein
VLIATLTAFRAQEAASSGTLIGFLAKQGWPVLRDRIKFREPDQTLSTLNRPGSKGVYESSLASFLEARVVR